MTTTEERALILQISLSDAQKILNALSERPHREVSILIPALMGQIQEQLKTPTVPQPTPAKREKVSDSEAFPAKEIDERKTALKAELKSID